MKLGARLGLYGTSINRPSFWVLGVPLVLLVLSRVIGSLVHVGTIEGWSFVVCFFWSPLMALHIFGAGKAWDDLKRKDYPRELAVLAMALNVAAPFIVVYFILYV